MFLETNVVYFLHMLTRPYVHCDYTTKKHIVFLLANKKIF